MLGLVRVIKWIVVVTVTVWRAKFELAVQKIVVMAVTMAVALMITKDNNCVSKGLRIAMIRKLLHR